MTKFLRCSARSKQTGKQCRLPAIAGGSVCRFHGGRAPQVAAKATERLEATKERVNEEYCRLAFFDVANLFDERGKFRPIDELDETTRRAIASIEFGPKGRIDKVRFFDKKGTLDSLAKTLGMFKAEQIELSTAPEGLAVRVTFVKSPAAPESGA